MTRRTLARPCSFHGTGIHSGASASLVVAPTDTGSGIVFDRDGVLVPVTEARRSPSRRNTAITFPDGGSLATVEHLLSALVGCGIDDALIRCDGPEVPILDGSALPYVTAFKDVGFTETGAPSNSASLTMPVSVSRGDAVALALPDDRISFTYIVDYPGTVIGTEIKVFFPDDGRYAEEIAPARTFATADEVDALRASGLIAGGSLDCAIVAGRDEIAGGGPLRVESEFAAHKLLDLIGDIALLGVIPIARYVCVKGGHSLHGALADRLRRCVKIDS